MEVVCMGAIEYIVEPQASSVCVIPLHLQYWLLVVASATEEFVKIKRNETMNMNTYGKTRCKK
jgi:hypothetical protein